MSTSLLADAFGHHVWATMRLLDACRDLTPEHLDTSVPGTYGSVLDTLQHLVESDSWYLHRCSGGANPPMDDADEMDIASLRTAIERAGEGWARLLRGDLDPDLVIETRRQDGSETHAPLGIRLAQVLHHGTDHRSQVCTALTTVGIEPPEIDVWSFGGQNGRVTEIPASS